MASNHQIYLWPKDYSSWRWYMKILTPFQGTETQWSHQAKCKFFLFFWPAWCSKNQILFFFFPFYLLCKVFLLLIRESRMENQELNVGRSFAYSVYFNKLFSSPPCTFCFCPWRNFGFVILMKKCIHGTNAHFSSLSDIPAIVDQCGLNLKKTCRMNVDTVLILGVIFRRFSVICMRKNHMNVIYIWQWWRP